MNYSNNCEPNDLTSILSRLDALEKRNAELEKKNSNSHVINAILKNIEGLNKGRVASGKIMTAVFNRLKNLERKNDDLEQRNAILVKKLSELMEVLEIREHMRIIESL